MTTYSIQAPDGNTYAIDGPPGASDDDVRSAVLSQHPEAGSARKPVSTMDVINGLPPLRAAAGVIRGIARPILGLKDLTDGLSDDEKAALTNLNSVKGGLATAGDIAGSALTLGPGAGLVGDLGSALPMAARAFAVPAMDAAANAGVSALGVPEQGQTRGGNAALGAAASLGGSALGGLVKGVSSSTYQSFLDLADKATGGLEKLFPSGYRNILGALEAVHGGSLVPVAVANAPKAANYLIRTKPVMNFATGETAAQRYLQSNFPSAIEYLSQSGAATADALNE